MKRLFDIFFAIVLGVALCPLLLVITIAMKMTSPGPVLFRQERLGVGGTLFLMNKFRKFPADWGTKGPGVTLQFDSRMTGIGRFLERTKLDELPQLWNIMKGEMSFVGPRPELVKFGHLFAGKYSDVLTYVPGIFGPNQVKYRNESAMYPDDEDPEVFYARVLFPAKADADLAYFSNASLLTDLACILKGVFAIVFSIVIWRSSMKATAILLVWDVFAVVCAWVLGHWLKFSVVSSATLKPGLIEVFKVGFVVAPVIMLIIFSLARVYRHPARYFSDLDFYRLAGACCVTWILSAVIFGITLQSTSSLLLAVVCLISVFIMIIPRLAYREWISLSNSRQRAPTDPINILVCGVSDQTVALCRLLKNGYDSVRVVGMLTEDTGSVRKEINGFEVLGMTTDLDVLHARYNFDQVWVGYPFGREGRRLIDLFCTKNSVVLTTLNDQPGFRSLCIGSEHEEFKTTSKPKQRTSPTPTPEVA